MLVIRNGRIHTITQGIIDRGSILIENGKIVAIGTDVPVPAGARVLDTEGMWVQPGIIEPHSHLGLSESGLGFEGNDTNEAVDPCTPHVRAVDGINPRDEAFRDAVEAGITAAWITPGSANVIGGQAATCRTWGNSVEEMVMNPYSAMKGAFGENPKRVFSGKSKLATRMGVAGFFRETFYKARAYMRKQELALEKGTDLPEYDFKLEPLVAVLKKQVPMRIHAHRQDDIMTILRLAREFDFEFTIEHCSEGHFVVNELAAEPRLKGVVVGPTLTAKTKVETANKDWTTPATLQRAGIRTCIMTDHPVTPVQYLPTCAAMANKYGMDGEEALKAITIHAAELCGVADRVGSLEVGKEADIAIFTGHPFDLWQTHTVATIINGNVVYENPRFAAR